MPIALSCSVILSVAKDLTVRALRSFAALRMTELALFICPRQHFTDQRKVRPEVITFPPILRTHYQSGLPASRVNIDAVPLPSLRQRVATGFVIGMLIQVPVDGERYLFLEVKTYRGQLRILSRKDNQQIGCSGNVMPGWRQYILIGNHPICVFFVERHAFLKQLLCDIVDLLRDDLF